MLKEVRQVQGHCDNASQHLEMILGSGPSWDRAAGPNEIGIWVQIRSDSAPNCDSALGPYDIRPITYKFLLWFQPWAKVNNFLDPHKGRSYKITRVCLSVCISVCLWRKSTLSIFSKSAPAIFLNFAQWKGTSIPIEWWRSHVDWCIGCPFWALFRPKFAQKLTLC